MKRTLLAILVCIFASSLVHGKIAIEHYKAKKHLVNHHKPVMQQIAEGVASWYGCGDDLTICPWGDDNTQGKPTASGIKFDTHKPLCASWYYPLHTKVIIKNKRTGKYASCRIEDRGPNLWTHRIIDVSQAVKHNLGMQGNEEVAVFSSVKPRLTQGAF